MSSVERLHTLFLAEYPRMVGLARFLGSGDPEDVAQEAFTRLHKRLDGLRDATAAEAYLRVTVVNLTRTARSQRSIRGRVLAETRAARNPVGEVYPSAEEELLAGTSFTRVVAALAELSRRQREVVVLRYWLDLSLIEIAEATGSPLGTVKSHLSRGLNTLRGRLIASKEGTQ